MSALTQAGLRPRRVLMVHDRARLARGSDVVFQEQRRALREAGFCVYSFTFDPAGGGAVIDKTLVCHRLSSTGVVKTRVAGNPWHTDGDVVYRENRRPMIRKAYRYAFNVGVYRALRRLAERVRPHLIVLNTYYNYPLSVLAACRGRRIIHVHQSAPLVCPNLSLRQRRTGRTCKGWFGWQCLRAGCVSPPQWLALVGVYTAWPALSRQWVARHAAASRPLAKSLRRRGMRAVSLLPLYVDAAQFPLAPYPAGPARVLYAGHVSAEKGVVDLFRAFGQVHRRHPGARLIVAGSGPGRASLEALAVEANLGAAIEFAGQVSHTQVGRLMAESAVVVMPSRSYEGFGLVGVEAMATGRPVVGTRVGGIPEWLADGVSGFLVEPGDVAAMGDRICRLLDNPGRAAEMGRRGRERVERLFDVSVFRRRFLGLIAEMMPDGEA